jgi:hypothetical protein
MKALEERGITLEELEVPLDEDGVELVILGDDLESRIIDLLKKDIAPDLSELESTAIKRYIQSCTAIKQENHDLNERLHAFDEDNKVLNLIIKLDF